MKYLLSLLFSLSLLSNTFAQTHQDTSALTSINVDKRKKVFWAAGLGTYAAASTALYYAWYDKKDLTSFHFFDDSKEWRGMDKAGHAFSAYAQSNLIFELGQGAGFDDHRALNIATVASLAGQLTIEVMDGFATDWGFSTTDVASNLLGTGLFYAQQKVWGQQKLSMKMSYWPVSYDDAPLIGNQSLRDRSRALYGESGIERFLKDYNGQTIWLSADLSACFPEANFPDWLSLAFGYSANNLYGGFENEWQVNGQNFTLSGDDYSRSSQFILALDYDLLSVYHSTTIGTALFKVLNTFKLPAPAVSYDTREGFKFHLFFLN